MADKRIIQYMDREAPVETITLKETVSVTILMMIPILFSINLVLRRKIRKLNE